MATALDWMRPRASDGTWLPRPPRPPRPLAPRLPHGRSRRVPGEVSSVKLRVVVTPTEMRDIREVARENGMASYSELVREAVNAFVADYRERKLFAKVKPIKRGNSPKRIVRSRSGRE